MKLLAAIFSILSLVNAGVIKAPSDEVDCTGKPDGTFLADPTDCSKFYICDGGLAWQQTCDPPLWFDPTLNICNWSDNVECMPTTTTDNGHTTTEKVGTTTEDTVTTTEEVDTTTMVVETTTEVVITTTEDITTTTEEVESTTEDVIMLSQQLLT
eukprot:TRINITY_DN4970_c0_g1_i15.p1 TRINITY_DN4970_c0_g1~~TRINITY_DN4970_c0_g1_i15.p1  ORF type:complete len:155 (-),score=44.30 TRINITY_DN4970_c0_g1_i15:105-569(-)